MAVVRGGRRAGGSLSPCGDDQVAVLACVVPDLAIRGHIEPHGPDMDAVGEPLGQLAAFQAVRIDKTSEDAWANYNGRARVEADAEAAEKEYLAGDPPCGPTEERVA